MAKSTIIIKTKEYTDEFYNISAKKIKRILEILEDGLVN